MRILFVVSDAHWSGRARAFALAARGLAARGHEVHIACDADCPVQVRLAREELSVVPMNPDATTAGDTIQLRKALMERGADVVFVHSDTEHFTASSALRLGGGRGAVIRRIPPFAAGGTGGRIATRLAPSGVLFSTEADMRSATAARSALAPSVAPLGIDTAVHDAVTPTKEIVGGRPDARLIACVHDGGDKRGVLAAMRTLALLAPRHPELHLAIVGAPHLDELRMHGAALGINPLMTLLGTRDDELAVLSAAAVGWVAAEGDAAAFAALDFMAMRIPVIASRSPLTEHYIADGIAGLLLPPGDPAGTAALVSTFLAKHDQHAAMGNAARTRLQREFTFAAMIDGFERAANAAVGRHAQPVA
jgi:glycosyltransferase involved in cell wall biosynthesis